MRDFGPGVCGRSYPLSKKYTSKDLKTAAYLDYVQELKMYTYRADYQDMIKSRRRKGMAPSLENRRESAEVLLKKLSLAPDDLSDTDEDELSETKSDVRKADRMMAMRNSTVNNPRSFYNLEQKVIAEVEDDKSTSEEYVFLMLEELDRKYNGNVQELYASIEKASDSEKQARNSIPEITHDPIYSYSLKEKMDILAAAEEEERMRNGQNDEDFFENCKRFTVSSRDSLVDYFNKKRETINENMQNVFRMDLEALQGLLRCDQRRSKEISSDDTDVETNQHADEATMAADTTLRDSGSLDLELLRRRTRLRLLREYRPSAYRKICLQDYAWITKLEDPSFDVNDEVSEIVDLYQNEPQITCTLHEFKKLDPSRFMRSEESLLSYLGVDELQGDTTCNDSKELDASMEHEGKSDRR
ncbi:hypothetical protein GUITHDRAFT_108571 [Guillardia theta CCMP2712]|uniref:Uncharacterized protein n=1 Tax=Guillardia theta (strain CCMP2712) TaxID=905079 RepID=L1JBK8_GUITC|nr:hypothetical protein GUITHDRAFT_108571 [Guillardia theta CCMP2712]EKX45697.1 hypothetical protein GUITHDRAFT_108571 [Guillardia theta CCMP2712]|eukprot:XP_005832677.1 hypothetical protein GUITHDRAFT_108571 [Guillardia theta CCMP2712]